MQGLLTMLIDGSYELTAFAEDIERTTVCACAVFTGTHNGANGPVAATSLQACSDYAYVMKFEDGKIQSYDQDLERWLGADAARLGLS